MAQLENVPVSRSARAAGATLAREVLHGGGADGDLARALLHHHQPSSNPGSSGASGNALHTHDGESDSDDNGPAATHHNHLSVFGALEVALDTLAGQPPPSGAPGSLVGSVSQSIKAWFLLGLGAWQTRQALLTGAAWWLGAQCVTLHIFVEGAYDAGESACACDAPPAAGGRGTVAHDFCLVCGDRWKLSALGVAYFIPGWFLGALAWGAAADRIGRRRAFLGSLGAAAALALGAAAAPGYWSYAAVRCALGFCMGGNGVVSYVLGAEALPQQWVNLVGVGYYHVVFAAAEAGLVLMAYYVRGWRALTLGVAVQAVALLAASAMHLHESPRWLIGQGRHAEALALLESAADASRSRLPPAAVDAIRAHGRAGAGGAAAGGAGAANSAGERGVGVLFSTARMAMITAGISFVWAVCGMVYYGVNNSAGNLPGSLYATTAILAMVELPGLLFGALVTHPRFGRKHTTSSCMALASASTLLVVVLDGTAETSAAVVGKLAGAAAFGARPRTCRAPRARREICRAPSLACLHPRATRR